jgi:hypothetical protein
VRKTFKRNISFASRSFPREGEGSKKEEGRNKVRERERKGKTKLFRHLKLTQLIISFEQKMRSERNGGESESAVNYL